MMSLSDSYGKEEEEGPIRSELPRGVSEGAARSRLRLPTASKHPLSR